MRQYCPHCSQVGEFADDLAGREAPCPNCKKPFTLRGSYTPGVAPGGGVPSTAATSPPKPTPPGVPTVPEIAPPPGLKTEAVPPIPAASTAHAGSFGISLNPLWLDFVPVGCLVLAFVLSFFPWASLNLGGYSILSQSGWESFAGMKSGTVPEGEGFKEWETLDQDLKGKDDAKKAGALGMDILIFPYLLLLIVAVALAVIERLLRNPTAANLPAPLMWLPKIWPLRLLILGGFAAVLLVLVGLAAFRGLGIERSVQKLAYLNNEKQFGENPTDTTVKKVWIKIGQDAGKYPVHQTIWLKLLLWAHVIALLACAARIWLDKRGDQPHPRLGLQW